jgi:hypothetical protein
MSILTTMALLACIACPAVARVGSRAAEAAVDAGTSPQLMEPVTDLPVTPAPQIDSITLFPNQGEITSGSSFNDQRFGYVLHGEARATYESNLFIQPQNAQEDFSFRISPGVAVGWGEFKSELYGRESFRRRLDSYAGKDYIYVDYAPSYTWFIDHGALDTFDHAVRLEAEWTVQRLTVGAHASYVTETLPVEDIGTRVEQGRLSAALTSRYSFSGKTALAVDAFYDGLDYDRPGVDSREWRNEDWLDYQVSPRVKLGVGGTVAYVERESGSSQDYEQARLRLVYELAETLTLGLSGGVEWRYAEENDHRADGIFQLDLVWSPLERTYVYVHGYRRSVTGNTEGSAYYVATGVYAQYRQRVFQRFFVELAVGYQNGEFLEPAGSPNFGRSDDLFFIRPGVGFDLAAWMNCEITGEYRQNDSNDQYGYEATKATVRFNLLF